MADLPRNVALVLRLLAERGPMRVDELSSLLRRDHQVLLNVERLHALPDRYPQHFAMDGAGRLALAARVGAPSLEDEDDEGSEDGWWLDEPLVEPIDLSRVVVLDIETTGLDASTDHVWEIAAVTIGTGELLLVEIDHPDRTKPDRGRPLLSFQEALEQLTDALDGASALAGHLVGAFDLPFLRSYASRHGFDWTCELPVLDLHALSLIVDPTLASRRLIDLAETYDVALDEAHFADHDARATADLIAALVSRYDPADACWALARRLLVEGGEPWGRVLPAGRPVERLADVLMPRPDPLVRTAPGEPWSSAASATRHGFAAIAAHRPGFRVRSGQLQMAEAVGEALDHDGRLAVEAPTGTGKSLAYLMPAAGRADAGRTVVVATHTKVLQRQLRDDAELLREQGLLHAPFRQVQGVANYLCTRELATSIRERDADGPDWFALAVAVRALAISENGLWDDVTDGLILRSDLRYAQRRRSLVASNHSCERRSCEWVAQCPLFARLSGVEERPGIMSVNHALIAAWVNAIRHGGSAPGDPFGEDPASFVFDEAHTLEDSLTSAWTDVTGALDLAVLQAAVWGRRGAVRSVGALR